MVGLAVPASVEPVPAGEFAGGGLEGGDTAQLRPGGFAADTLGIVAGGDTEDGGGVDTDAVEAHQPGSSGGDGSSRTTSSRAISSSIPSTRRPRLRMASFVA